MPDPITDLPPIGGGQTRKEKRKTLKKLKRKRIRKEAAIREREEEEARLNDPQEQLRIKLKEEEEAAIAERGRREFEEREKVWIEAAERRRREEEKRTRQKLLEESERRKEEHTNELEDDDEWDYAEDGPAEIIWKGNEIILKKKRVKVAKKAADRKPDDEDVDRPTSNPLPPQSVAFSSYNNEKSLTAQELLEGVAQQVPNFGTEQDKAHCPFHLKTGACRFGTRCSRVHFYPDKSCTLLIKSMYNGPGLAWDQDEGLEYTDEEVERCYEEFYEDVHTEFLKFGELVNFKVCKNGSYHLRGNVYVHYKSLESAILAYNTINGRYFAGKQITCQFVGVTRWKVAICGEYMKSRLRTCSHGTACNFIHCFRNPGGDYEWADWDNPPPQYWIRKMAVLFGHSDELSYGRQMELEDCERRRDSSRKGTPMHVRRYHLKRSCDEMKVRDRKRDRRGSHSRIDNSERRRETSFREKSEQSEENHESKVHDYDFKNHPHSHGSSEDRSKKKDSKKHQKHEAHQKHKKSQKTKEELFSWQPRDSFSDKQEKSERKHKLKSIETQREEQKVSDQLLDSADDGSKRSNSQSSEDFYFSRHGIDSQDRYDGRYCSDDRHSGKDFSNQNGSRRYNQVIEKIHRHKTRNHNIKHQSNDDRPKCDESSDRWETTVNISDREETHDRSCDGSSRSHWKATRSDGERRRHKRKRKHEINSSCSDEELDRREHKYSRSQTPTRWMTGSEKTIQGGNNN